MLTNKSDRTNNLEVGMAPKRLTGYIVLLILLLLLFLHSQNGLLSISPEREEPTKDDDVTF